MNYCAGKLHPETTSLLHEHMQSCPECRRFVKAQTALWNALDAWQDAPISPAFDRRLYSRIAGREAQKGVFGRFWDRMPRAPFSSAPFRWQPAMPVAAACLFLTAGVLLYVPAGIPTREIPVENSRGESLAVDVEQVERTLDDIEMLRQLSPAGQPGAKSATAPDSRNL
ncbi:MAG TPA: hypothetical protein VMZ52_05765 [Bryobacteraceae bacterium]|nr:hypothetical protein [Bryobacteraceae bacterium]